MVRSKALFALMLGFMLTGCGGAEEPEITAMPASEPVPVQTEVPLTQMRYEGPLLPLRELCDELGYELEILGGNYATIEGRELEYFPEQGYMSFNGRYLYAPDGWETAEDGIMLEANAAAKILGLDVKQEGESLVVDITRSAILPGGEGYYDVHFDMDMLYWLPQIISSEAGNQPLAGQIAVGNVVMNRINSERFPNDIASVIYDMAGAVQFEPVINGSIKNEPEGSSLVAAYLCLEGYNTAGNSLFFMNPSCGVTWFDAELELVTVIGEHNFYNYKE